MPKPKGSPKTGGRTKRPEEFQTKPRCIRMTDKEYIKIKEFLKELRKGENKMSVNTDDLHKL